MAVCFSRTDQELNKVLEGMLHMQNILRDLGYMKRKGKIKGGTMHYSMSKFTKMLYLKETPLPSPNQNPLPN